MRVTLLHSADALEPPEDPVLGQLTGAIESLSHEVTRVSADEDIIPVAHALRTTQPDLVFNLIESFAGVSSLDSSVTALLNLLGLRYTGSSPAGLLLAGDKSLAKQVLGFHSVTTPQFATMYRGAVEWAGEMEFPVIVKPPQEDASIGITSKSVVHDLQELFGRLDDLHAEFQTPVLVEEFIQGREFYVGVIGNLHPQALPIIELDFSGFPAGVPHVASWEAKWGTDGTGAESEAEKSAEFAGTKSIFPTDLDEQLYERMQETAVRAFEALRLRDYARIDLRVSPAGEIYVIEVNPNCYLERNAEFSRAAERDGLGYDPLIARIIELASARYAR
ncbi:MAG TPA: ATP-grasp domain-containing protein [Gemmatimonadaceae bacterium]|nr:ATP-grasp domain-containing protein [Gemmatimonadaceae bacterium]